MSWAVVEPHGAVERASETSVTANEVATGTTLVTFGNLADVTECAYEATIGLAGQSATAFPGFATVVRSAAHENAILVQTFNENGVAAELRLPPSRSSADLGGDGGDTSSGSRSSPSQRVP